MREHGFCAKGIHGDKQQRERDEVLEDFKHGQTSVLVRCSLILSFNYYTSSFSMAVHS